MLAEYIAFQPSVQELKVRSTYQFYSFIVLPILLRARGGAVVDALRYKLEGHRIDSRWCHRNFSLL
jgi:hypothetical protein